MIDLVWLYENMTDKYGFNDGSAVPHGADKAREMLDLGVAVLAGIASMIVWDKGRT